MRVLVRVFIVLCFCLAGFWKRWRQEKQSEVGHHLFHKHCVFLNITSLDDSRYVSAHCSQSLLPLSWVAAALCILTRHNFFVATVFRSHATLERRKVKAWHLFYVLVLKETPLWCHQRVLTPLFNYDNREDQLLIDMFTKILTVTNSSVKQIFIGMVSWLDIDVEYWSDISQQTNIGSCWTLSKILDMNALI